MENSGLLVKCPLNGGKTATTVTFLLFHPQKQKVWYCTDCKKSPTCL